MIHCEPDFSIGFDRDPVAREQLQTDRDSPGYAYVYVFEMDTGVVKVGRTTSPRARITSHLQMAAVHAVSVKRCWVSDAVSIAQSHAIENRVCSWASETAYDVLSAEYFRNLDFDAAVSRCIECTGDIDTPVSLATIGARQIVSVDEALSMLDLRDEYNGDKHRLAQCLRDDFQLPFRFSNWEMSGRQFTEFCVAAASRYVAAAAVRTPNSADRLNGIRPAKTAEQILEEGV